MDEKHLIDIDRAERSHTVFRNLKTPFEVSRYHVQRGSNPFLDVNYDDYRSASFTLAKKLIEIRKEEKGRGLSKVRSVCDYLVAREISNNSPGEIGKAMREYGQLEWGTIGESLTSSIVGFEMLGAYYRYLTKYENNQRLRAKYQLLSIPYTLSPFLGGLKRYAGEIRKTLEHE